MHFPLRLCPSCVAEPAVVSVGQEYVAGLELLGATSAGKSLGGLLRERQAH